MHGFPGTDTVVAEDGHIGHGAVLHGCRIGRNSLVGMNAVINEDSIVGAAAFVKADVVFPPRSLIAGVPAKRLRELSDEEIAWKREGTLTYQELTRRCQASLQEVVPLTEPEPGRQRLDIKDVEPLYKLKQR
jgi:phenylacetic acid degradation protein